MFIAFLNELLTYGKPALVYKIAELPRSYSVNKKLSTLMVMTYKANWSSNEDLKLQDIQ